MRKKRRSWGFAGIPLTLAILALGVILWSLTAGPWVWVGVGTLILVEPAALAIASLARPHGPAPSTRSSSGL